MPVSTAERPVSVLRQRMMEDMAMRGLRPHMQHDHIRFVRSFAGFLGRSPDMAQAEDIRRFQIHQRESGLQPPTINCSALALRFFFTVTLDRPDMSRRLVLARYPRKLPAVPGVADAGPSSRPLGDGGNPARHLTRPHQPGAPRRDPARLALTSRRNTTATTNAPRHALHQDHRKRAGYQPQPDPDSGLARRKISRARLSPGPAPSRFRRHHNQAKLEIPIDRRRSSAASCMSGFRTPAPCPDARPAVAGIQKPSPSQSFWTRSPPPGTGRSPATTGNARVRLIPDGEKTDPPHSPFHRHGRACPGHRASTSVQHRRGASPLQEYLFPSCSRPKLRRRETGWGATEGERAIRRMTNSIRPCRLASQRWNGEAQTRDEREACDADRTGDKAIEGGGGVFGDGEPGR